MIVRTVMRPPTPLTLVCKAAEAVGVSPDACLANTGIRHTDLSNPDSRHSTEQEIQVIENFVKHAPRNVGLGLKVGQDLHVNAFGIWGFAILTSPTLRSAIDVATRYIRLSYIIAEMNLVEDGKNAILEFNMSEIPELIHRFILERHAAVGINFVRELIRESNAWEFAIHTMDNDPTYPQDLQALSGVRVRGAMSKNALIFPITYLDRPLTKSDPASLKFCIDQCKAILAEQGGEYGPWSEKVREALISDISAEQKIENVARKLTMTERTLRRRLTDEGISFREIYTDTRMSIARELLDTAKLNVETVAWRVGYAEPASFVRAFSKKFGKTPGAVKSND